MRETVNDSRVDDPVIDRMLAVSGPLAVIGGRFVRMTVRPTLLAAGIAALSRFYTPLSPDVRVAALVAFAVGLFVFVVGTLTDAYLGGGGR